MFSHLHFFYPETFEEALELEKMYEKHRNSDSFEEEQIRKKAKRDHPIEKISKRDVTKNKYHGRCAARRPLKLGNIVLHESQFLLQQKLIQIRSLTDFTVKEMYNYRIRRSFSVRKERKTTHQPKRRQRPQHLLRKVFSLILLSFENTNN